jgi:hypothetical protein
VPEDGFDPGTPNQSYGRKGDYYLSSCGGYWLSYSGEAVTGNLVDAPRWARDPEMQPVLMAAARSLRAGPGRSRGAAEASREDPALDELMLDTRAFLRGDDRLNPRTKPPTMDKETLTASPPPLPGTANPRRDPHGTKRCQPRDRAAAQKRRQDGPLGDLPATMSISSSSICSDRPQIRRPS